MNKILKSPAQYVQGKNVLQSLGDYLKGFEKGILLIISQSGERRFGAVISDQLLDRGFRVVKNTFGGECTRKEVEAAARTAKDEDCAVIVGVGGGKILDTAKAAAYMAGLPSAVVPTVASTDSPCSSLSVLYHEDGEFDSYLFLNRCPDLVLVDTMVIAKAPPQLLTAGMGDALATWFEARACRRSGKRNQIGGMPTAISTEMAALCWKYLKSYGLAARTAAEAGACTEALEKIVEVNTYLSSVGFESGGLAAAHAIQKGFTRIPELHRVYHGDKVAFCTIAQLILEDAPREELEEVLEFCRGVGLPMTFADMNYEKVDRLSLEGAAEAACLPGSTVHNMPFEVTPYAVYAALLAADAMGRRWKLGK